MRTLNDANLIQSVALPAAGATAYTPVLDTSIFNPGRTPCVEIFIATGAALPNLTDPTKHVTFTLQDSPDGINFNAAAADLPSYPVAGVAQTGAPALAVQVKVPINLGRYQRLQIVSDAGVGDCTAVAASFGYVV